MAFARAERERDAARRELADAKAEVERLMRERDAANEEAGEAWEHVCKIDAVNARLRRDVQDAQARLAELESASATARGAYVDDLRRVLGCGPGETMLEAAKRLTRDLDDYRKAAEVEASLGDEARAEVKRLCAEADGRVLAALERAPVDLEPLPPELEACLDERIADASRSAFDVMAEKAGPLPTAVLAGPIGDECDHGSRRGVEVERARIVAMLLARSTWHYEQARKLRQTEHAAAALALEEMANRIERGEV